MSDESVVNRTAATVADVEAEHALQYKLLDQAERLVAEGDPVAARAVIQQLYDYSEAHFGSEQVLMRLHSYPGYQAHEREHGDLLVALRSLLASVSGDPESVATGALRRWLTAHIHHSDRAFFDYLTPPLSSAGAM